jgi:hypothetical protein
MANDDAFNAGNFHSAICLQMGFIFIGYLIPLLFGAKQFDYKENVIFGGWRSVLERRLYPIWSHL